MSSESFSLKTYDCVGFDLDNTIIFYDVLNMSQLIYNNFIQFFIEQRGYAGKYLSLPLELGLDFLQKGLTMDFKRGNVVKMDPNGVILRASHGTRPMSKEEISNAYGPEHVWDDGKKYCEDLLEAWNGPLVSKVRSVLCYFDSVTPLVFARTVDTLDEDESTKNCYDSISSDLIAALEYMYGKEGFQGNTGGYFPALKADPLKYIKVCPESTVKFLKKLKELGKFVFLLTGSAPDFASFTSTTALGPSWADLFDLVIFFARKPNFFIVDRPFLQIQELQEGEPVKLSNESKFYAQGNWKELGKFIEGKLQKKDLKMVYVGDSAIQDVFVPVKENCCDTICISQELNQPKEHILGVSAIWGDYFNTDGRDTLWKHVIDNHAKLTVDSLPSLLNYM